MFIAGLLELGFFGGTEIEGRIVFFATLVIVVGGFIGAWKWVFERWDE